MKTLTFRLQAWGDLFHHYARVFRAAWAERESITPKPRTAHEAEFLPAALALQETPVGPAPRLAAGLIVAFCLLALAWSIFGRVDVVATAPGKIIPSDRTKTIQAVDTATVKAIHVRDGQAVRQGQVLLELDPTSALADRTRLEGDLISARLQVARGQALLQAMDTGKPPALGPVAAANAERLREAQTLLAGQFDEFNARLARIAAEEARREAELTSVKALVQKLEATVPIARQRAQDFKDLVDRNFVSKHGHLEREQSRIEMEGDLTAQRSRQKELEAGLREVRTQRAALISEARRATLDNINEGTQRADALQQELAKAENRDRQTRLLAPVDGYVQQLAVHTVGGVVTPAQPLMAIVPDDQAMEIEAFIENKDVGFVRVGQEAEIKLDAFPYTRFGTIPAKVASISHDAISDEKRGLIYAVRLRMTRNSVNADGQENRLGPGMAIRAEIKTDQRRLIEYILSPLQQYADESFRER